MSAELQRLNRQIEHLEAEQERDPDPTLNLVLEELYTERDEMTGKGHVPEENVERYRRLAGLASRLESLGGQVSGYGEYGDANLLWAMASKYREKANELRADLPQPPPTEEK